MDYLRRLHPSYAETDGAARLDVPPRFGLAAAEPPVQRTAPARSAPAAAPALPPAPRQPLPASKAPATMPADDRRTHVATRESERTIERLSPSAPVLRPATASALSMPVARPPLPPASKAADPPTPVAAPPPLRDATPRAASPRPAPPSGGSARAPLRIDVLRDGVAQRQPAEPAPIVHVTIDRIDVRLPPAPAADAPARKPRPASTVAPLADYLRSCGGKR